MDEDVTEQDLKTILKKMEDHDLFADWARVKRMIISYIKMEWMGYQLPTSDELLAAICSVINDPRNQSARKISRHLNKREMEILTCSLWTSLVEKLGTDKK